MNECGRRILNFVLDKYPLARKKAITPEDDLLESGVIDSLGILDLVAFIEQEFGIAVADDELVPEHFQSVQCITVFVDHKRTEAAASRP